MEDGQPAGVVEAAPGLEAVVKRMLCPPPTSLALPCAKGSTWVQLTEVLSRDVTSVDQFCKVVNEARKVLDKRPLRHFEGLVEACNEVDEAFVGRVLGVVMGAARDLADAFADGPMGMGHVPSLLAEQNGQVRFTRRQILSLLSHAMLTTLPTLKKFKDDFGRLSMKTLLQSDEPVSIARLLCLFDYFVSMEGASSSLLAEQVVFLRRCRVNTSVPDWAANMSPIVCEVQLCAGGIEDSPAAVHIDFANKHIHIGSIIPSATQEEDMREGEVVLMAGARRFSRYSGYARSFRHTGSFDPEEKTVATGNWGCGVFGGDPTLKFLQQIMAASAAGVTRVEYSVFSDEKLRTALTSVLNLVKAKQATICQLYRIISEYSEVNVMPPPMDHPLMLELQLGGDRGVIKVAEKGAAQGGGYFGNVVHPPGFLDVALHRLGQLPDACP